jgi:hypothetical protein
MMKKARNIGLFEILWDIGRQVDMRLMENRTGGGTAGFSAVQ